jgi:hypothetical protein
MLISYGVRRALAAPHHRAILVIPNLHGGRQAYFGIRTVPTPDRVSRVQMLKHVKHDGGGTVSTFRFSTISDFEFVCRSNSGLFIF